MGVSLPRSDDYLRTFFHLRYDVRRPMQWQRLAFFQLGSDFYNETPSRRVAIGDENGLREEWEPKRARMCSTAIAVPMTGAQPWLSIHGLERSRPSARTRRRQSRTHRALVARGARVASQRRNRMFRSFAPSGAKAITAPSSNSHRRPASRNCSPVTLWRPTWNWWSFPPTRRPTTGRTKSSRPSGPGCRHLATGPSRSGRQRIEMPKHVTVRC